MYKIFNIFLALLGLRYPTKISFNTFGKHDLKKRNSLDITSIGEIDLDKFPGEDSELDTLIDFQCIRIPKFTDCVSHYKQIIFWFYSVMIFLLLMSEPIFILYQTIIGRNLIFISNIAFLLISPIQFIIAIKYFRSQSFDKIYYEVSKLKDTPHCIRDDRILSLCILIPATISIIISIIFVFIETPNIIYPLNIYSAFSKNTNVAGKVFLFIFEVIYWIYSRNIIFLVVLVFFFVFFKHINDMKSLIFTATNTNVWVDDQTIVSEFIHVIIKLRYELADSINRLSNIYVTSTILGAVGMGNIIDNLKTDPFTIISCIIFVLFQLVFLYIIYLISQQQENLGDIIRHPVFSAKYIYRKYKTYNFNNNFSPRTSIPFLARSSVDSALQDYSATSVGRLLKNFREKSIKSDNNSPLYQVQLVTSDNVIPLGNLNDIQNEHAHIHKDHPTKEVRFEDLASDPINQQNKKNVNNNVPEGESESYTYRSSSRRYKYRHKRTKKHYRVNKPNIKIIDDDINLNNENSDFPYVYYTPPTKDSSPITNNCEPLSPILTDIVKNINQISSFNGASTDYLILNTLISDNWTNNFELLGFQFNSTDSIKKALGITAAIIALSGIISQFVVIS